MSTVVVTSAALVVAPTSEGTSSLRQDPTELAASAGEVVELAVERLELGVRRTVPRIDVDDAGLVRLELFLVVVGVGDDDHTVAGMDETARLHR